MIYSIVFYLIIPKEVENQKVANVLNVELRVLFNKNIKICISLKNKYKLINLKLKRFLKDLNLENRIQNNFHLSKMESSDFLKKDYLNLIFIILNMIINYSKSFKLHYLKLKGFFVINNQ